MTRPKVAAQHFVDTLTPELRARLTPIYSPLLRIESTGAVATLSEEEAVIFTSSNGVEFGPDGAGRRAFCVGTATTAAAIQRGWDAVKMGADVAALIDTLQTDRPLVHLSGVHTRGDLLAKLGQKGIKVRRVPLYDQVLCDLTDAARTALQGEVIAIVPLFSPRTARHFFDVAPCLGSVRIVALSMAVAEMAPAGLRANVMICAAPDAKAMRDSVSKIASSVHPG